MDKEYQNLREKVTDNESENVKKYYCLNEKGLILYFMYLTYHKLIC